MTEMYYFLYYTGKTHRWRQHHLPIWMARLSVTEAHLKGGLELEEVTPVVAG